MEKADNMNDLTVGNETRLIFKFALPMLIGNIFQQLYNTVDSIIVGRALGKEALAAVGASFPIINMIVGLIMGITLGSTVLISQYYGSKDTKRVKRTVDTTYVFLFFASIIMTAIGLATSGTMLELMNVPPEIYPMAKSYLDVTFIGIVGMFGYNSVSAILRGIGDSVTPLYFLIIATILNIVLDILFIITFDFGVAGAAWATAIAQAVSFILSVIYLNMKSDVLKIKIRDLQFDKRIFKLIIKVGLPSGIQRLVISSGAMALQGLVNSFGADVIAAFTAAVRLDSFAGMPVQNFGNALSSFVGQNMGAGKVERAKKGFRVTMVMSFAMSVVIAILISVFASSLMGVFTDDLAVIEEGVRYLRIVSVGYPLLGALVVSSGLIRGAGNSILPMFMSLASLWIIRVPIAAILSKRLGTAGLWLGVPIGWMLGAIIGLVYYRTGRWEKSSLVEE